MKLEKGWTESEVYCHHSNGGIRIKIQRQEEGEICAIIFELSSAENTSTLSTYTTKQEIQKIKEFFEKEYHK